MRCGALSRYRPRATVARRPKTSLTRWATIHGALPPHPTFDDQNSLRRVRPSNPVNAPKLKYKCFVLVSRMARHVKKKINKNQNYLWIRGWCGAASVRAKLRAYLINPHPDPLPEREGVDGMGSNASLVQSHKAVSVVASLS